ncbi:MAG: HAMP domain-containing sensor histidine kinase [Cyanobacteria bacterium J06632_22]
MDASQDLESVDYPTESHAALSQLAATAQSLESLRHDFVTSASHEFRTPLTVIASSVGILRDFGNSLDPDRRQLHFERIQIAIQQITQLLDDMLMANAVAEETVDCHPKQLDIVAWYQEFINELQQVNKERKICLTTDVTGSRICAVDEALFRQILCNLFSNALKYSPPDTPVSTTLRLDDCKLSVRVSDQGRGIPKHEQKQVFQPFFRGSNIGHVAGLGLGLSMAQACVVKHAGTLEVDSVEGMGTIVSLELSVPSASPRPIFRT